MASSTTTLLRRINLIGNGLAFLFITGYVLFNIEMPHIFAAIPSTARAATEFGRLHRFLDWTDRPVFRCGTEN